MISINEYCGQISCINEYCGQISCINEYLSAKIDKTKLPQNITISDYLFLVLPVIFGIDKNDTEKIIKKVLEIIKDYKMSGKFRVFSNSIDKDKLIQDNECDVAVPFTSMMISPMENYCDDVFQDILNNSANRLSIELEEFDINIDYIDFCICIYDDSEENYIILETLDEDIQTINPRFKLYHDRRNTYIEISDRPLIAELNNMPEDETKQDRFWIVYKDFVEDYVNRANSIIATYFIITGGQGKHVCVNITMFNIHKYNEIEETVKDLQNKLLKDAQDEIDYLNSGEEDL